MLSQHSQAEDGEAKGEDACVCCDDAGSRCARPHRAAGSHCAHPHRAAGSHCARPHRAGETTNRSRKMSVWVHHVMIPFPTTTEMIITDEIKQSEILISTVLILTGGCYGGQKRLFP